MRKINDEGLAIIKRFEGLRLNAYYCPAGVLTIGYGSTGAHVKPGMKITEAEAERLLREDVRRFEEGVEKLVTVPVNDNQFSALVSFAFNVGLSALGKSTLLKRLNAGNFTDAATRFGDFVYANKRRLAGLEKRRAAERALFVKDVPNA